MIIVGCLIFMIIKVRKLFKKITFWFLLGQNNRSLTFFHNNQRSQNLLLIFLFINPTKLSICDWPTYRWLAKVCAADRSVRGPYIFRALPMPAPDLTKERESGISPGTLLLTEAAEEHCLVLQTSYYEGITELLTYEVNTNSITHRQILQEFIYRLRLQIRLLSAKATIFR